MVEHSVTAYDSPIQRQPLHLEHIEGGNDTIDHVRQLGHSEWLMWQMRGALDFLIHALEPDPEFKTSETQSHWGILNEEEVRKAQQMARDILKLDLNAQEIAKAIPAITKRFPFASNIIWHWLPNFSKSYGEATREHGIETDDLYFALQEYNRVLVARINELRRIINQHIGTYIAPDFAFARTETEYDGELDPDENVERKRISFRTHIALVVTDPNEVAAIAEEEDVIVYLGPKGTVAIDSRPGRTYDEQEVLTIEHVIPVGKNGEVDR